jgi:methylenetetrahydrofolate reductase (NADPH)
MVFSPGEATPVTGPVGTRFRTTLADPTRFATLVELVPWAGPLSDAKAEKHLAAGRELAADPRVAALTVTDNAGGHVRLSPLSLGRALVELGANVVAHVSCRDRSRGALKSLAWDLASAGITDILALSGDYPADGFEGLSRAVFDIDSVALLAMLDEIRGAQMDIFAGAAINPYKLHENELVPQLLKLALKQRAGARFTITQVGWDVRATDELLRWMRRSGVDIPAIGCVYILSAPVARYFHDGKVPGATMADALHTLVEAAAAGPDKGRGQFLEIAAMQVAVARGLGFRGVYLAGQRNAAEIDRVLTMADGYGPDDWRGLAPQVHFPRPGTFRLFRDADASGALATDELTEAYARSLTPAARKRTRRGVPLAYRTSRLTHDLAFTPGTPGFRTGTAFYDRAERWKVIRPLHVLEQAVKAPMFGCRDCGDCSLPEIAYLCPESQCAKNQRNGPCGGTHDGQCEVPGRPCIWSKAYDRLKPYGEELTMLERPPTLGDNALRGRSAWANTYLGRDHAGRLRARTQAPGGTHE